MSLSREFKLKNAICDYLLLIPQISSSTTRQNLIKQAQIPPNLQSLIQWSNTAHQFISLLVSTLYDYGTLDDERYALEAVLEAAKEFLEPEQHMAGDELIRKLRAV